MSSIELKIKSKDWLYILLIGVSFAALLSALGYILMLQSWLQGALFGMFLGFSITLFSLLFVTYMNQYLLPQLKKWLWLPVAALFSFLSGFAGTLAGSKIAEAFHITLLEPFVQNRIDIALAAGLMTYVIGALLYRFVKMRNHKEQIDAHYLKSRLASLETQLNPHFLFNALNSVAELIHTDPQRAERAILKMSSFLRNSMNERSLISIEEELDNVKAYVSLENIRFGDRIVLNLPASVIKTKIPKFSIQLLVENAIKHGFTPGHKALHVTLFFDHVEGVITVQNDGSAMKSTTFGVGLTNLQERLHLLCDADLKAVQSDPPTFEIHLGSCYENTDRR